MKRPKWMRAEKRHNAVYCPACAKHHAARYVCHREATARLVIAARLIIAVKCWPRDDAGRLRTQRGLRRAMLGYPVRAR